MKFEDIKKKIIIELSIAAGVVVITAAVVFGMTMLSDNFRAEQDKLKIHLAAVTKDRKTLEGKYDKIKNNMDMYHEVLEKNATNQLSISMPLLRKKVDEFKPKYFLNDFSLVMSPAKDMTEPQYRYPTSVMEASTLTANFDALTDEDLYAMLKAMQDELSGGLKITKFSIARSSKVTDETLRTIARTGQYTVVKGDMKLTWFGIRVLDAEPAAEPAGVK